MLMLALLTLGTAQAGDFMDTWVTLGFEDSNVLAGPEDQDPGPNFVRRGNRTFFEDYESRYSDDITQSHLVIYRRDEAFWDRWYTEAAVVLQFTPELEEDEPDKSVDLEDDGTYIRLFRSVGPDENDAFSITGYAVDASRFRLGYSYDLSWGGREMFTKDPGAVPGVRVQYQKSGRYAFLGAKTAIQDVQGDETEGDESGGTENHVFPGFLAGAGLELGGRFRLEGGAGIFNQMKFQTLDTGSELFGEDINALGFAGQVAWRTTEELEFIQSSELRLYRNTPDFLKDSYISHRQLEGSGLLVQAEANYLVHNLLDKEKSDMVLESGIAGDVQLVWVRGSTELGLDFVYKDLAYILFNVPGISAETAIGDTPVTPQVYGRFKVSHYVPESRVAPSFGIGLKQPATYQTDDGNYVVVIDETDQEPIPEGAEPALILGGIAGVQVDVSPSTVLVAEALYTRDDNKSDYVSSDSSDMNSTGDRVAADANERNMVGFNLLMRARF